MISDKETNTIYFSRRIVTDNRFKATFDQITSVLDSFGVEIKLLSDTKDIWARDYMPIQVTKEKFVEYRYDPDYLLCTAKGHRESKTYADIVCDKLDFMTTKTDIILDGGNVIKSNDCVILTDKIVVENKFNYSEEELIKELRYLFEVDNIILIPWDLEEEYGHADGMLRFIDNDTVLINSVYRDWKELTNELKNLSIEFLDFNVKLPNEELNWAYINFLQTKDIILIPEFGIEEDEQALKQIKKYYPDYTKKNRIFQINMNDIVIHGGALNCISWTIKE